MKDSAMPRKRRISLALAGILLITFIGLALRLYSITSYRPIEEDTGLHTYVVYDFLTNHSMFYRDMWSPQTQTPISFLLKAFSVSLFGYNQVGIRFMSVLLGTLTILLVYLLGKKLYSEGVGVVAAFIFAVDLPYVVEISRWGYDMSYFTPFVTLGIYFFACFYKDSTHKNLKIMVSGFFLGTASMMKLYALPVVGVVLVVLLFENFRSKRTLAQLRYFTVQLVHFLSGFMIIPLITFAFVFSIGAWNQYVFTVENGRLIALTFDEKIGRFSGFVDRLLPALLLSIPEMLLAFYYRKARLIPVLWLLIPVFSMFFVPNFIDSTFNFTSPAIMILAAATLVAAGRRIRKGFGSHSSNKTKLVSGLIVVALAVLLVQSYNSCQQWAGFLYSDNPQVTGQAEIADFIRANTRSSDLIFTTDASLAVLSQRTIAKVGTIKVAGFYPDLFGYDGVRYVGIPGYPQGIITPPDVLKAIQTQRPAIIILTKSGSVAFAAADQLIFNGDPKWNSTGIGPWLVRNYAFLKHLDNAYGSFDVWADIRPRTLVFEDFEEFNSSSGRFLTVKGFGENTSFSYSQEQDQPIYGNYSAKINYYLPEGENASVQLAVKLTQPTNLSSFDSLSVWVRGNGTPAAISFSLVDAHGNQANLLVRDLGFVGEHNFIASIPRQGEIDLSHTTEVRVSILSNSQSYYLSGTVYIDDFVFVGKT